MNFTPPPEEPEGPGGCAVALAMIATGDFPDMGAPSGPRRGAPRASDGLIRLDVDGIVTFASPNGLSAFNRMGFSGELEGESLAEVTTELLSDLQDAQALFGGSFSVEAHYGLQTPDGGPQDQLRGRIMAKVGALRMLCDSPELLRISAGKADDFTGGSQYCWDLVHRGALDPIKRAPKLDTLTAYITAELDTDPTAKIVIFSLFREMIDLIRTALHRFGSVPYTGAMNAKEKEAAKQRFQHDTTVRLLVSTDAGGYGVDLPQASILINYDLPWASGTARQRDSRIIRASSTHDRVYLRDMLIRDSIEERHWNALQAKTAVAAAVIDGQGANDRGGVDLTVESLTAFLGRTG